jgi:hypothetical protein
VALRHAPPQPDPILASRQMEHAVLTGPGFERQLADSAVFVARLPRTPA